MSTPSWAPGLIASYSMTDRARLVPGIVEMRGRSSFERVYIGFVNVNASKAKCALVSASRS